MLQNQQTTADAPPAKLVAQGLAIVKMENESQQQMAILKPRNEAVILDQALKELDLYPEFAVKAFYSIPYKNKRENKTEWVEGPSIHAAMALARRWGNCANSGRIVDDLPDRLLVQCVFLDYETNVRTLRDVSVPRTMKTYDGRIIELTVERLQLAIQKGVSIAVRNAILASLPDGLKSAHFLHAKELTARGTGKQKDKPVAERLKDAKALFKTKGVNEAMMAQYILDQNAENDGQPMKDDVLLTHLIGIWNALEDGTIAVEDIFGGSESKQPQAMPQPKSSSPTAPPPKPKDTLFNPRSRPC